MGPLLLHIYGGIKILPYIYILKELIITKLLLLLLLFFDMST
jgi:hypothetical protein